MLPVIALVGRPNVGKSTLFNRVTRTRAALVADQPGLTRDRQYGEGQIRQQRFIVIDTGGLGEEQAGVDHVMRRQTEHALQEADFIVFLVDARAGLTAADEVLAATLRRHSKPVFLVANKMDGIDPNLALAEFHTLGYSKVWQISATHGRGVDAFLTALAQHIPQESEPSEEQAPGIHVAVVGRPNVGKSTLINRILGEERVVVFDAPGTTRDSIFIPFERRGQIYTLIDTAGVRRRARVTGTIEKFSVVKALQAIEAAHVVVMVIDAHEGITGQDLHLLGFVLETGKSLVIAFNKWDGLPQERKDWLKKEFQRRLTFLDYAKWHMISALHGTGVGDLFASIQSAYASAMKKFPTSSLTRILQKAVEEHTPPLVRGRRIKLRYAHAGGHNPPVIVVHGNQVDRLPGSYRRYLENYFRHALRLVGTPIRFEFRQGENPYEGQRNKLTPHQQQKRKRMLQHVKRKK